MSPWRRVAVAFAAAVAGAVGLLALGHAPMASAHAGLQDTSPRSGSVLEEPPTQIVLDFDEDLESSLSSITLLNQDGRSIDLGEPTSAGDRTQIVANITSPDEMAAGIYVVIYRVTSADSHPVSGSFTFAIGNQGGDQQAVLDRLTRGGTAAQDAVSWMLGAGRFVAFAGLTVLFGAWLLTVLTPRGVGRDGAYARQAWTGLALLAAGSVAVFLLQGPRASGRGFGAAFDTSLWSDVASTKYGKAVLTRLLLVALAALPNLGLRLADLRPWRVAAGSVALCLLVTFGMAGHPEVGRWPGLGIPLDVVHLGAVSIWVGGLVVLATKRRAVLDHDHVSRTIARRFSSVALVCVPVAVVTGVVQSWRVLRHFSGVNDLTYGRTLVAKVAAALLLVVLGGMARVALQGHGAPSIRRIVVAEAVVGLGVLGLTAGLVALAPELPRPVVPVEVTASQGDLSATLTITPAQVGSNDVHLTVTQGAGALEPTSSATIRISQPDQGIPPEAIPLTPEGADHYSAFAVQLPFAGTWQVDIVIETSASATVLLQTSITVTS